MVSVLISATKQLLKRRWFDRVPGLLFTANKGDKIGSVRLFVSFTCILVAVLSVPHFIPNLVENVVL